MRRFLRIPALVLLSATMWFLPSVSQASAAVDAIVPPVTVTCTSGEFELTMAFTHRGRVEARFYTVQNGVRIDSEAMWFRGTGDDSYTARMTPHVGVSFEAHLLKLGRHRSLLDAVPYVTLPGPYSC